MQDAGSVMSADDVKESGALHRVSALETALADRTAKIAVIGLGYVGLPLLLAISAAGFRTIGVDRDAARLSMLDSGQSYLSHVDTADIATLAANEGFWGTSDFASVKTADAVIICVPTPLTAHREPDLSAIEAACRGITLHLKDGALVVLESTSFPGTTRDVVKPLLEAGGRVAGRDFLLAYSPEREDPGRKSHHLGNTPKIIGADDATTLRIARLLYEQWVDVTIPVSSLATAEAVKITENVFRSVNIALANELKLIFEAMSINIWEVIDAAKTKPFGYMPFYPGPGLGGHCIPVDPFYLAWKAKEYGASTKFIELAGEINRAMPHHVVDRLARAMDEAFGIGLKARRILILGVAYKKDIADARESPALEIIRILEERGCSIAYHDPLMPEVELQPEVCGRVQRSIALDEASIAAHDAVVICTDHERVDYSLIARHARLILDTRNIFHRLGLRPTNLFLA